MPTPIVSHDDISRGPGNEILLPHLYGGKNLRHGLHILASHQRRKGIVETVFPPGHFFRIEIHRHNFDLVAADHIKDISYLPEQQVFNLLPR